MESMETLNQTHCCTNASMDLVATSRMLDSSGPQDAGRDMEKGSQMNGTACEPRRRGLRTADVLGAPTRDGGLRLVVEIAPAPIDQRTEEQRLVARCMLGDKEAWATMFREYHPGLISYLKLLTRLWGGDGEQAEEVAAAVWCSLYVGTDKALKRYNPEAGSLLRFLKFEARSVFSRWLRSEKRGRLRECKVARKEAFRDDLSYGLVVEEFLATLTRRERELCTSILLSVPEAGRGRPISGTNECVIRGRIKKKLRIYMIQNN